MGGSRESSGDPCNRSRSIKKPRLLAPVFVAQVSGSSVQSFVCARRVLELGMRGAASLSLGEAQVQSFLCARRVFELGAEMHAWSSAFRFPEHDLGTSRVGTVHFVLSERWLCPSLRDNKK